jgi:RNA polymerase sigma factor (sigma-70 family)
VGYLPRASVAGPSFGPATDGAIQTHREPTAATEGAWQISGDMFREVWRAALVTTIAVPGISSVDREDIAQEVLLKLHAVISRGVAPRAPGAWARTVARRYAWKSLRHTSEWLMTAEQLAALGGTTDNTADLVELAERDQMLGWVRQLRPERRAVVALYMDGYSSEEIADALQISHKVVRIRLSAALQELRKKLVAQMDHDRRSEHAEGLSSISTIGSAPRPRPRSAGPLESSSEELAARQAIANMPRRQSEVLRLSRRGYKPAQIAQVLGLSPNTVRVNLCHARKRMRRNLELNSQEARNTDNPPSGRA